MTTWNKVTKASGTSWTKIAAPSIGGTSVPGSPIGLLLALTYATAISTGIWTPITKATGTVWNKITKAS